MTILESYSIPDRRFSGVEQMYSEQGSYATRTRSNTILPYHFHKFVYTQGYVINFDPIPRGPCTPLCPYGANRVRRSDRPVH